MSLNTITWLHSRCLRCLDAAWLPWVAPAWSCRASSGSSLGSQPCSPGNPAHQDPKSPVPPCRTLGLDAHRPAARAHPSTDTRRRAAACERRQRGSPLKKKRGPVPRRTFGACLRPSASPASAALGSSRKLCGSRLGDSVSDTGAAFRPDSSQTSQSSDMFGK